MEIYFVARSRKEKACLLSFALDGKKGKEPNESLLQDSL
jgi:hypothetical protein